VADQGVVIKFPLEIQVKSCLNCQNVLMGVRGLFCWELREEIVDDEIADQCDWYENDS